MTAKVHHAGQKPVTVWIPEQVAAELDQTLAALADGVPGLKPSRQAFIVDAIKQAIPRAVEGLPDRQRDALRLQRAAAKRQVDAAQRKEEDDGGAHTAPLYTASRAELQRTMRANYERRAAEREVKEMIRYSSLTPQT